jgi:predicted DNA-binding transcriptional regulator AlpA
MPRSAKIVSVRAPASGARRNVVPVSLADVSQPRRVQRPGLVIEVIAVSVPEAAALLGLGRTHFYRLHRSDPTFPRIAKFGRASRILVADLREWARKQASGTQ